MKIVFKIGLIFIFGGIMFLCSTCTKQKWFEYITYDGHVIDHSGNPLSNITITLNGCNVEYGGSDRCTPFIIGKTTTDASGHFYIYKRASRSGRYKVTLSGGWTGQSADDWQYEKDLKSDKWTKIIYP